MKKDKQKKKGKRAIKMLNGRNARTNIGAIIVGLTNATPNGDTKAAEAAIFKELEMKPEHLSFAIDSNHDDKLIVIPHKETLEAELKELKKNPKAAYPIDDEYLSQASKKIIEDATKAGGDLDSEILKRVKKHAKKALKRKDFLVYRVGEYCISQCR